MAVHQGKSESGSSRVAKTSNCFRLLSLLVDFVSETWGRYTHDTVHEPIYQYHYCWWIVNKSNFIMISNVLQLMDRRSSQLNISRTKYWFCAKNWEVFSHCLCILMALSYTILYSRKIWRRIKFDEFMVDNACNSININIFTSTKFVRSS